MPSAASATAGVESEPTDPQERCPDGRVGQVVRRHRLAAETQPLADQQGADQRRDARADMHDCPAGKVQRPASADGGVLAAIGQNAAAPHPVAQRAVDQRPPENHEHDHRGESHPLGKRPTNQGRRDDEEHPLEEHVGEHGHGQVGMQRNMRLAFDPRRLDPTEQQEIKVSQPRAAAAERQRVPPERPNDRHQPHQKNALHHHAEHVLLADQAAVEQGQPGAGHHQHQRRTDQQPGVVARVDGPSARPTMLFRRLHPVDSTSFSAATACEAPMEVEPNHAAAASVHAPVRKRRRFQSLIRRTAFHKTASHHSQGTPKRRWSERENFVHPQIPPGRYARD